jgi:hypothetical protein
MMTISMCACAVRAQSVLITERAADIYIYLDDDKTLFPNATLDVRTTTSATQLSLKASSISLLLVFSRFDSIQLKQHLQDSPRLGYNFGGFISTQRSQGRLVI